MPFFVFRAPDIKVTAYKQRCKSSVRLTVHAPSSKRCVLDLWLSYNTKTLTGNPTPEIKLIGQPPEVAEIFLNP